MRCPLAASSCARRLTPRERWDDRWRCDPHGAFCTPREPEGSCAPRGCVERGQPGRELRHHCRRHRGSRPPVDPRRLRRGGDGHRGIGVHGTLQGSRLVDRHHPAAGDNTRRGERPVLDQRSDGNRSDGDHSGRGARCRVVLRPPRPRVGDVRLRLRRSHQQPGEPAPGAPPALHALREPRHTRHPLAARRGRCGHYRRLPRARLLGARGHAGHHDCRGCDRPLVAVEVAARPISLVQSSSFVSTLRQRRRAAEHPRVPQHRVWTVSFSATSLERGISGSTIEREACS